MRWLSSGIEHVFDEDAIASSWVIDKDVRNGADEFAILDDGGSDPTAAGGRGREGERVAAVDKIEEKA